MPEQCVLAQVMNNLAGAQPSLRVPGRDERRGTRLCWQGTSPWSADQLLGGRPGGPARVQARAFLLSATENRPRLVRELWAEGQRQGLSARTLRRARQELSIRSQRVVRDGRRESY